MNFRNLFSRRAKRLRGDYPDVFQYTKLPDHLRVQLVHVANEALIDHYRSHIPSFVEDGATRIVHGLRKEYGVFSLTRNPVPNGPYYNELMAFLLEEQDTDKVLDGVEMLCHLIELVCPNSEAFIEDVNLRFREAGVGFQYSESQVIRIDSTFTHEEIVKPALLVLRRKEFSGAQEEYLLAFEHYRHSRNKEALTECAKAFESVLKVACRQKGWPVDANAPAKKLLETCFDRGLLPEFWVSHFGALRALLESGVPTARNKLSAHGQGYSVSVVPSHIVRYVLNSTAAAILLVSELLDQ